MATEILKVQTKENNRRRRKKMSKQYLCDTDILSIYESPLAQVAQLKFLWDHRTMRARYPGLVQ